MMGAQTGATETVTYLQGPQGPPYRKSSLQTDPVWYVYDGLGSVVGEVNVNGNVTGSKLYDVYGATRSISGSPTSRQGFVGGLGHESDDETGLIYMRARYYDPLTGRFASEDPSQNGDNWFVYSGGNPVNNLDFDGHSYQGIVDFLMHFPKWAAGAADALGWALGLTACSIAQKATYSYVRGGDFTQRMGLAIGIATIATGCFAVTALGLQGTDGVVAGAIGAALTILQGVVACILTGESEASKLPFGCAAVVMGAYALAVTGFLVANIAEDLLP